MTTNIAALQWGRSGSFPGISPKGFQVAFEAHGENWGTTILSSTDPRTLGKNVIHILEHYGDNLWFNTSKIPILNKTIDLTDTGEDSKLVHRQILPKVDASIFFFFFPTRPSDEYDSAPSRN